MNPFRYMPSKVFGVNIDPMQDTVAEGMRARNAGDNVATCPYSCFQEGGTKLKAHWIWGWSFRDYEIKKGAANGALS